MLYTSDPEGRGCDTNSYLQAPDPEGEVGSVIAHVAMTVSRWFTS